MKSLPKRKSTSADESRGTFKTDCFAEQSERTKHSTDPAPVSMPQPSKYPALDLFDATRISGRGPSACLALVSRYRLGNLIHVAEGQVLRIHANRFRAAAIAEWGRRDGS